MDSKDLHGKRYICLVRASDPAQAETSTEAQLALLKDYGQKHGMIFVDQVVLEGVTASLPGKRRDLTDLLERKRKSDDFDVVILQRMDRLTRGGSGHGFWTEHEFERAGVRLIFVGDEIPDGPYAGLIKAAKYQAAQEQAFSISQRSTQGAQLALEQGRNATSSHTPYACHRMYLTAEGHPSHIIRDLRDGRQEKLDPKTRRVIDIYGHIGGGGRGHYRKQKTERVAMVPGDPEKVDVVREIFNLHFRRGWGGKRIADLLNTRGTPSPCGRAWSQHQVEVIYEQEIYTGRSVGNRTSSAIYHERNPHAPKRVELDLATRAAAARIPVRQRPREEWLVQEQPHMLDFLDAELRQLARTAHEELWRKRSDPHRPKQRKSRHKASEYLLSGLFFAKQDGEPLVGILCGPRDKRVRYYRHRRGRRGYRTGSVFNGMFRAEPLERAVVEVVQSVLADMPRLRTRIEQLVDESMKAAPASAHTLDDMRKRTEEIRRRIRLIVATFDEQTLADAKPEIDRLQAERRSLSEQIAASEAEQQTRGTDPQQIVDRVMNRIQTLAANLKDAPTFALREFLNVFVERVVGDMETKAVEVTLALPDWAFREENAINALRPVGTSASSSSYQTQGPRLYLEDVVCESRKACYECRRENGRSCSTYPASNTAA